jgi:DNA-directed RNA polymerase specialized sigma24 family protein
VRLEDEEMGESICPGSDIGTTVDRAGTRLAPSHATVLRLAADGASECEIARSLAIPEEAVATLLEVARAKLARLARREP